MYEQRMHQLNQLLGDHALDAVVLLPGSNLQYLTGLSFHLMERPILFFVTPGKKPILVAPALEQAKAEASTLDLQLITYGEDQASREAAFTKAVDAAGDAIQHVGVEPLGMRFHEFAMLKQIATGWDFSSGSDLLAELRLIKNEGEVELMRELSKHTSGRTSLGAYPSYCR